MNNVGALSRVNTVSQGREGPGIWEQNPEGFMDFMQALMNQSESPAVQAETAQNAPPDKGFWMARLAMIANPADTDVKNVGISSAAEGQEDLMSLVTLLTGEENNDDFLRALEQYIAQNPEILDAYNALFSVENAESPLAWLEGLVEALKPEGEEELPPELMPLLMLWTPPNAPETTEEAVISGTPGLIEWDLTGTPEASAETPETSETAAVLPDEPAGELTVPDNPAETLKTPVTGQDPPIAPPEVQNAEPYIQDPAVPQMPLSEGLAELILPEDAEIKSVFQEPASKLLTGEANDTVSPATPAKPHVSYANMVARAVAGTMRWKEPEDVQLDGAQPTAEGVVPQTETDAMTAQAPETAAFTAFEGNTEDSADTSGSASGKSEGVQLAAQQSPAPVQTAQTGAESSPPAARQVLAKDIISQIAQNAAHSGETTVLQMELHPKFLGKIEIILEASGGNITAKLKSDNGAVRSLLNENIAELRDSLRQAGINMRDVEVTETAIRTGLSDRQYQRHEQASQTQQSGDAKPIRIMPFAADFAEEAESLTSLYETGRVATPHNDTIFDYRA